MRAEKKNIVEELSREIENANPLVFTDYKGIKANNLMELRGRLTEIDARYKVVKNRLFKKSLGEAGIAEIPVEIKGPLAIAYGGRDVVEVIKALIRFAKDNPDSLKIKGGFVDNMFLPVEKMETLSKLPTKEILIGKLVCQIAAPLSRFAMVLQGSVQKLVCALSEISKKKGE